MRNWLFLIFMLSALSGFSQTGERRLVQFSGIITNRDSNTVVPYVTITNQSGKDQYFSANYKGYFSFVAHEGDTLAFTAVGYKKESLITLSSSNTTGIPPSPASLILLTNGISPRNGVLNC